MELKSGSGGLEKLYKVFDILIQDEPKGRQSRFLDIRVGDPDVYVLHMLMKLTPNLTTLAWTDFGLEELDTPLSDNTYMQALKTE